MGGGGRQRKSFVVVVVVVVVLAKLLLLFFFSFSSFSRPSLFLSRGIVGKTKKKRKKKEREGKEEAFCFSGLASSIRGLPLPRLLSTLCWVR